MQNFQSYFDFSSNLTWQPYLKIADKLRSSKLLHEGTLTYSDKDLNQKQAIFKLYTDHLMRIENVELYKTNQQKAIQQSNILFPLVQISIDMFSFKNDAKVEENKKFQIILSYNNGQTILFPKNESDMFAWYEQLKTICIQHHFDFHYKRQKQLGEGAFAQVVQATRLADDQVFAVKIFNKEVLLKKKNASLFKKSISKEILILRLLFGEDTIKLYEVYEDLNNIYLVMDLMNGGELFDRIIQKGNYSERDACILMRSLLEQINYIHKNNIIHRDIKPENLIFKDKLSYELKIVDFGLSEFVNDPDSLYKRSGTPGYVAPEILKDQDYNNKADIFSLGVIILTGCSPFFGDDIDEIVQKNQKGSVCYDFDEINIKVSNNALDLLKKLLQTNQSKRLTAEQALKHDWITKTVGNKEYIALSPQKNKNTEKNAVQKNLLKIKQTIQPFNLEENKTQTECYSPLTKKTFNNLESSPLYKKQKNIIGDYLNNQNTNDSDSPLKKQDQSCINFPSMFMKLYNCSDK